MPSVRGNNRRRITTRLAVTLVAASLLGPAVVANDDPSPAALKTAVKKGLDLLEKTSPTFVKKGGCNSCHNQMLPAAAQAFARGRGIATGETIMQLPPEASEATAERYVEYSIGGGVGITALGFELFAAAMDHRPADAASMIHALRTYAVPAAAADTNARIDRARPSGVRAILRELEKGRYESAAARRREKRIRPLQDDQPDNHAGHETVRPIAALNLRQGQLPKQIRGGSRRERRNQAYFAVPRLGGEWPQSLHLLLGELSSMAGHRPLRGVEVSLRE